MFTEPWYARAYKEEYNKHFECMQSVHSAYCVEKLERLLKSLNNDIKATLYNPIFDPQLLLKVLSFIPEGKIFITFTDISNDILNIIDSLANIQCKEGDSFDSSKENELKKEAILKLLATHPDELNYANYKFGYEYLQNEALEEIKSSRLNIREIIQSKLDDKAAEEYLSQFNAMLAFDKQKDIDLNPESIGNSDLETKQEDFMEEGINITGSVIEGGSAEEFERYLNELEMSKDDSPQTSLMKLICYDRLGDYEKAKQCYQEIKESEFQDQIEDPLQKLFFAKYALCAEGTKAKTLGVKAVEAVIDQGGIVNFLKTEPEGNFLLAEYYYSKFELTEARKYLKLSAELLLAKGNDLMVFNDDVLQPLILKLLSAEEEGLFVALLSLRPDFDFNFAIKNAPSPLHLAIISDLSNAVGFMLSRGADVQLLYNDKSPLLTALEYNAFKSLPLLINKYNELDLQIMFGNGQIDEEEAKIFTEEILINYSEDTATKILAELGLEVSQEQSN